MVSQVKRNGRRGLWLLMIAVLLLAVGCSGAAKAPASGTNSNQAAQEPFPTRPIVLVYHSKAGSGGDIFLRNLAKVIEKDLGQPILVENRTGASGANAWTYVQKAKADGHILIGTSSTIVSAPILTPMPVSYKDFTPVAQLFNDPQLIYVRKDAPWKDAKELIEYAKANPGKVAWGRSTPGSGDSIALAMLQEKTGINVKVVSFEGGSDVIAALLGGHVQAGLGEYSELRGQVESGEIKILGSMTSQRLSILPNVPTLKELGTDVVVFRPRGIMAPKGTPDYIVDRLNAAFKKAYEDPEFKKTWEADGAIPEFVTAGDFMKKYDELNAFLQVLLKK